MPAQVFTQTLFIYKFIGSSGLGLWPRLQEKQQENRDRATQAVRGRHQGPRVRCRSGAGQGERVVPGQGRAGAGAEAWPEGSLGRGSLLLLQRVLGAPWLPKFRCGLQLCDAASLAYRRQHLHPGAGRHRPLGEGPPGWQQLRVMAMPPPQDLGPHLRGQGRGC